MLRHTTGAKRNCHANHNDALPNVMGVYSIISSISVNMFIYTYILYLLYVPDGKIINP